MDDIDISILKSLHEDCSLSNKQLAAKIGLAPSSTLSRVKSLADRGAIRGYHADIDPSSVGIHLQAMLAIVIQVHSTAYFKEFHRYLESLIEVKASYHTTGNVDLLVHVLVKDSNHLRNFVLEKISSRTEVMRCETSIIYEEKQRRDLPSYLD